jgi:hypothetical protein
MRSLWTLVTFTDEPGGYSFQPCITDASGIGIGIDIGIGTGIGTGIGIGIGTGMILTVMTLSL